MPDSPTETTSIPAAPAPRGAAASSARVKALIEGPIAPTLFKLALPNIVSSIVGTCAIVLDTYYVGRLGVAPLAALALVFPIQTLMNMISSGAMGGGVSSAVARALGAVAPVDPLIPNRHLSTSRLHRLPLHHEYSGPKVGDGGGELDEAAGESEEHRPEGVCPAPVDEVVQAGEDDMVRGIGRAHFFQMTLSRLLLTAFR